MIIVHSNTKLLNPFGEAVTSPLFFVLLKDPLEILITALRHCRYAPMAEGSDCTSILNLYGETSKSTPGIDRDGDRGHAGLPYREHKERKGTVLRPRLDPRPQVQDRDEP